MQLTRPACSFALLLLFVPPVEEARAQVERPVPWVLEPAAAPYYAIVTPDGQPVATFLGMTRDEGEFARFLAAGLTPRNSPGPPLTQAHVGDRHVERATVTVEVTLLLALVGIRAGRPWPLTAAAPTRYHKEI
ncbi:MAG: hypothetical protein ABR602_14670 [Gemmatimonadales bacterium]